ncbi:MAG: DsbA family protein [Dehalococcoidia bacterium]
MGLERVDRLRREYNVTVRGKAFLLRPDIPEEGVAREPRPEESGDQLREPLRTYAQEAGLVMRRPSRTPYTLYALQATEYAREQGQFDAFHHAAYRVYWEHGKDLGDMAVLQELAEGCGLNWPELKERLDTGYHRATVLDQYREAINMGIHGIPAFLVGSLFFTGAQPYEVFQTVMSQALAQQEGQ